MATLTLSTDKKNYEVGDEVVATLTVSDLAPGEEGWEKLAELAGRLELSTGETVRATGEVTISKDAVEPETADNPGLTLDGVELALDSFDGTTATFRGIAG